MTRITIQDGIQELNGRGSKASDLTNNIDKNFRDVFLTNKKPPYLVVAGDSRGAFHVGGALWSVRGPYNWARYKLNQRFEMDPAWNTAVASTLIATDSPNLPSLKTQLPTAIINAKGGFIAIFSDVNDIGAGRTAQQMIDDMTPLINQILEASVTPILHTCVIATYMNTTQRGVVRRYNSWLRSLRTDHRIIVIDTAQRVIDWTSTTSQPIGTGANGYLYDTTHFGPISAELIGDDIFSALDSRLPPAGWHGMTSPEDSYDSINNPSGSFIGINGSFNNGGGALTAVNSDANTASTGNTASGTRLYKVANAPIDIIGARQLGFITLNGTDIPVNVMNIKVNKQSSPGTGQQVATLKFDDILTSAGLSAGDIVQMAAWVNIKSAVGLYGAGIQCYCNEGGTTTANYGDLSAWSNNGVYSFLHTRVKKGFQKSGKMTLTSGVTKITPYFILQVDAATAQVEVEIAIPAVRKLT